MDNKKKILGLDLGVGSIGWCLVEANQKDEIHHIIDLGVYTFDGSNDSNLADRRGYRSMRRLKRRKQNRLSSVALLLETYLDVEFPKVLEDYQKHFKHIRNYVYETKLKGLSEKLSKEELSAVLYHYAKYRGYKSNRKNQNDKNEGVLLDKINHVSDTLKSQNITVTRYILNNLKERMENDEFDNKIHNDNYQTVFTFSREMYLDEIEKLLDTQIKFGVITKEFKDAYIEKWGNQRNFSEGPGLADKKRQIPSPYGVLPNQSLFQKTVGICPFDRQIRAPKNAYSSELFVLLSKLANLRYRIDGGSKYYSLDAKTIQKIIDDGLNSDKKFNLSYNKIAKVISKTEKIDFPEVTVFNKEIKNSLKTTFSPKNINKYFDVKGAKVVYDNKLATHAFFANFDTPNSVEIPVEANSITFIKEKGYQPSIEASEKTIYINTNIDAEDMSILYQDLLDKKLKKNTEYLETYTKCKNILNEDKPSGYKELLASSERLDEIAYILMSTVNEELIKASLKEKGYNDKLIKSILKFPEFKGTLNLSSSICRELCKKIYEKGITYDKAMEELGYIHSDLNPNLKPYKKLPPLKKAMEILNLNITSPDVLKGLKNSIKIINAIIEDFDGVDKINVELARELAKSNLEKYRIRGEQESRADDNISDKLLLFEKFPNYFKSPSYVSRTDLDRYRLYKEQNGICAYTGDEIDPKYLFSVPQTYEIDHVIPYSRALDDSYNNKVLVHVNSNRNKGNKTPYEWMSPSEFKEFTNRVKSNKNYTKAKIDKLLTKESEFEGFLEKNLNDTRYISKAILGMCRTLLNLETTAVNGMITDFLKKKWNLNTLTHSYESEDLSIKKDFYLIKQDGNYFSISDDKSKELTLQFKIDSPKSKQIEEISFKLDYENKGGQISSQINSLIEFIYNYKSLVNDELSKLNKKDTTLHDLIHKVSVKLDEDLDENNNLLYTNILYLLSLAENQIGRIGFKKNRDNHLHHALDAYVIACSNTSLIQRVTKYYKYLELNDFKEESLKELGALDNRFPVPYKEYRKEIAIRLYEQRPEVFEKALLEEPFVSLYNDMPAYQKDRIQVVIPAKTPTSKQFGRLHQDTAFGLKEIVVSVPIIKEKIDVIKKDLNGLENIKNKITKDDILLYNPNIKFENDGNYLEKIQLLVDFVNKKEIDYEKLGEYYYSNQSVITQKRSLLAKDSVKTLKKDLSEIYEAYKTNRKHGTKPLLSKKDFSNCAVNILNISGGSNNLILALCELLYNKEIKKDSTTFTLDELPKYPNKDNLIKSYVSYDSDYMKVREKIVIEKHGNNKIFESDNVYKLFVYSRKNDENLYYAGLNLYAISSLKKGIGTNIKLFKDRKSPFIIPSSKLAKAGFRKVLEINKDDLIKVSYKRPSGIIVETLCYFGGFTGGSLSIKSVLGDYKDLIYSNITDAIPSTPRVKLSVSNIQKIEVLKLTLLGKIKR